MNLRVFFWLFAMKKIKPLMMTDYHTSLISRVERFHGNLWVIYLTARKSSAGATFVIIMKYQY